MRRLEAECAGSRGSRDDSDVCSVRVTRSDERSGRCGSHTRRVTRLVAALALLLGAIAGSSTEDGWPTVVPIAHAQNVRVPTARQEADNAEAERVNSAAKARLDAGDEAGALELAERAAAMFEKLFGADDIGVASALETRGAVHLRRGDLARAEADDLRELAILEKALGSRHEALTRPLNALSVVYHGKGDFRRALAMAERALAITEATVGPDHPNVATLLNNAAEARRALGEVAPAEALLRRALAIRERALGPGHPDVAISLENLAVLVFEGGHGPEARTLLERALAIEEKAHGPDDPALVTVLNNIAFQTEATNDLATAERTYLRALTIAERRTPDHPTVVGLLDNLAALAWRAGRMPQALALESRADEARERHVASVIAAGSERDRRLFLSANRAQSDGVVSLHTVGMPKDPAALRLAFTHVLRHKGRLVDVAATSIASLRAQLGSDGSALLDRLARQRDALSRATLAGAGDAASSSTIADLRGQIEQTERQLASRSAAFRERVTPVTLDAIRAALPPDAALVEIALYRPFQPAARTRWGAERYVAYVMARDGEPAWVDLGDAAVMDRAATDLRRELADARSEPRAAARALDARLMAPLRPLLGARRHLIVAPDGALSLVPFGALIDESGSYLVQSTTISYVTSGRDLLRAPRTTAGRSAPLVLAAPDFDARDKPGAAPPGRLRFSALPGAGQEGRAVAGLLDGASLREGAAASETALKTAHGPLVLHVATHGFFLAGPAETAAATRGLELVTPLTDATARANPLLRSGLAFAGANVGGQGADDGVLTAYEAASLDLGGTKLVVLSACDTGVGDAVAGDGVYGLRRALLVAGAEALVTSLWKVDDDATRDLMIGYYAALRAGGGRAAALRDAQLALQRSDGRAHPYHWASFIEVGDWRTLAGADVAPASGVAAATVPPGAGCGCRAAGGDAAWWPAVSLILAWWGRRSRARRRRRAGGQARWPDAC